ncbi:MAG: signal recognition particle-docking protein FtsY [Melioribacteraceae bacterium]|nr:signal recognition particle-docking protein FtsY [Melioribacteraceae bacterium]
MKLFKNINLDKLKSGLNKTRDRIFTRITETVTGKAKIDDATLEEIEDILITSDIGFDLTERIIEKTRKNIKSNPDRSVDSIINSIKQELINALSEFEQNDNEIEKIKSFEPYVILIVGVNGAGKTTTVGKLSHNFKKSGLSVVIGSADTFRAAANEQLDVWAKRAGVEIFQKSHGADPSSVAFDTIQYAKKNNIDVVIIDTAGRLHTKTNLMEELKKIKKVLSKVADYAPNETYLVLDGNTGQNAIIQANEFSKYTDLSGLIITKLDGTAKGGVIFQIIADKKIPVKYIGVGEGIEDLQTFDAQSFVTALFQNN